MKTPQEYMKPRPGKDFGFAHYCYKFWYQYCLTPGGWTEHGTSQQEAKQEANRRVKISFYKTLKRQPK